MKSELGSDNVAKSSVAFHRNGRKFKCRHGIPKPVEYEFQRVFNMNSTQEQLFESIGVPVVQGILESYNCAIVCFGRPNTGKTYSLVGAKVEPAISDREGLLQRCVRAIFNAITEVDGDYEYTIRFSCYEITADGDAIIDLMNPSDDSLEVAYHEEKDIVEVENLSEMYVEDPEEIFENLGELLKHRHKDTSLFFELIVTQREIGSEQRKVSRLTLVDLNTIHDEDGDVEHVFEDMVEAIVSKDDNFDFFANTVRAMLYGRALTNCSLSVLMHCSPSIESAQATVDTLALHESLAKLSIEAHYNMESTVEVQEQLQEALELAADQLRSPEMANQLRLLQEKEIEVEAKNERLNALETELEIIRAKYVAMEKEGEETKQQLDVERTNSASYRSKLQDSQILLEQLRHQNERDRTSLKDSISALKQKQSSLRQLYESLRVSSRSQLEETKNGVEQQIQLLRERSSELQRIASEESRTKRQEIQQYRSELVEKDSTIESLKDKVSSTELQVNSLDQIVKQKDDEIERLNALVEEMKSQSRSKENNDITVSLEHEISTLKIALEESEKSQSLLKTQVSDAVRQREELTEKMGALELETKERSMLAEEKLRKSREEYEEARQKCILIQQKVDEQMVKLANRDAAIERMKLELKEKEQQYKQELASLNNKNDKLGNDLQEREARIVALVTQVSQLDTQHISLNKVLSNAQEKIRALEGDLAERQHEEREFKKRMVDMTEDVRKLTLELEARNEKLRTLEQMQMYDDNARTGDSHSQQNKQLLEQIDALNDRISLLDGEKIKIQFQLNEQITELRKEIENGHQQLKEKEMQIESLEVSVKDSEERHNLGSQSQQERISSLQHEMSEYKTKIGQLQNDLDTKQTEVSKIQEMLTRKEEAVGVFEREASTLRTLMADLTEKNTTLAKELDVTKNELETSKQEAEKLVKQIEQARVRNDGNDEEIHAVKQENLDLKSRVVQLTDDLKKLREQRPLSSSEEEHENELKKADKTAQMLKTVQRELFEKLKLNNALKTENATLSEAQKINQSKIADLREKLSKSEIENIKLRDSLEEQGKLELELANLRKESQDASFELREELSRIKDELEHCRKDFEQSRQQTLELQDILDRRDQRVAELESSIESQINANEQTDFNLQNKEIEIEQLKKEIEALKQHKPSSDSSGQSDQMETNDKMKKLMEENEKLRTSNRNFQRIQHELNDLRKYIQSRADAKRSRNVSILRPVGDKVKRRPSIKGASLTVPRAEPGDNERTSVSEKAAEEEMKSVVETEKPQEESVQPEKEAQKDQVSKNVGDDKSSATQQAESDETAETPPVETSSPPTDSSAATPKTSTSQSSSQPYGYDVISASAFTKVCYVVPVSLEKVA